MGSRRHAKLPLEEQLTLPGLGNERASNDGGDDTVKASTGSARAPSVRNRKAHQRAVRKGLHDLSDIFYSDATISLLIGEIRVQSSRGVGPHDPGVREAMRQLVDALDYEVASKIWRDYFGRGFHDEDEA